MKIALDAMGGDYAPDSPISGAIEALNLFPDIHLILVGNEPIIKEIFYKKNGHDVQQRVEFLHTSQVVGMEDPPIESVRHKRDSSISRCIELAKKGEADAVVSAGNTGAVVAAATVYLRTLPGISRAGIASVIPTEKNPFILIDSGAIIDSTPENLLDFGIMGSIYAKKILGVSNPRVGLLSIGTENVKGNELTRSAFKLLSKSNLNFVGNIEGRDLFENPVDVVVCDGFVGNVVLKTSESVATAVVRWLKREFKKNPIRILGAFLAKGAFESVKKKTNYEEYGGALLLGIRGTCIIAHGSSTPKAICNAIRVAREALIQNVNHIIIEEIKAHHELIEEHKRTSLPIT
ncbi:phosphate acyltransferase PlsX [Candidatus Methylacidiphilum fumarolicum]|uniref:Phosphate acyltransferase n=2 Tax=Candidatus Methylacidiphilum fumarolicum TaxID=591154 RepID=I0K0J7_METFB|nr:phosphate acyltransferase PlsX [Candidatus Methylacidiphilum fumarolicum]MBW6415539.1 phosphate acyltransferase PlsX [Candidatus Methylacidiphilum fumarolicum]TFE68143.1 phosphate acyltransferase PlsX [Candidatus Methylacidiphilum fumarolicum]TFE73443.1 phosphate acyltransferase PlsX [Candidatus Methylacidiphilum fumarolicum]TFE74390.1 phosphate acyltransferase PlsX [Candidatus Methylacidiphilum fumarolicum]TFE76949.1 phosphate acyltransferase PlsX [Candidatus Methylacidiphilum fumarolicum]